ncbi:hypothetical protein GQ54DRAFT_296330 [Martensiomyces pterosporus]|nr:hypothetical protein GQ54DRAFT_296330 [Martensiomyces pterosporus]
MGGMGGMGAMGGMGGMGAMGGMGGQPMDFGDMARFGDMAGSKGEYDSDDDLPSSDEELEAQVQSKDAEESK